MAYLIRPRLARSSKRNAVVGWQEVASDVGDHEVGKWLCHSDDCDVIALMLVAAEVTGT